MLLNDMERPKGPRWVGFANLSSLLFLFRSYAVRPPIFHRSTQNRTPRTVVSQKVMTQPHSDVHDFPILVHFGPCKRKTIFNKYIYHKAHVMVIGILGATWYVPSGRWIVVEY